MKYLACCHAVACILLATATVGMAGPLHTAVQEGDLDQVRQEISSGADVNEEDPFLGAPLILAAIKGNTEIVELLIGHGALVKAADPASGTPLHAAALHGHLDIVEILIGYGADIHAVRTSNGETPLHAAAEGGNRKIVELLISLGADVNARSNDNYSDNYSPIHSAAASGHFEVVELLRAHGASPPPIDPIAPLMKLADPQEGSRLFTGACGGCHSVEEGGPNKTGPNLWDIVGRKRASLRDFDYSPALIRHGGAWDYETLNAFIATPRQFIPGTKMFVYPSTVAAQRNRAHIIAYLRQLSDNPAPLP